jgi:hypothetical protein
MSEVTHSSIALGASCGRLAHVGSVQQDAIVPSPSGRGAQGLSTGGRYGVSYHFHIRVTWLCKGMR